MGTCSTHVFPSRGTRNAMPGTMESSRGEIGSATQTGAHGEARTARILVAEDDPDTRSLVARVLRMGGHRVYETGSGSELLQTLRSIIIDSPIDGVDLVVSDLRMPGLSGLEVARMLRAQRWDAPIILMTALSTDALRDEAEALGVTVLMKPFSLEDLLTAARVALSPR